jgi:hypothetical protein
LTHHAAGKPAAHRRTTMIDDDDDDEHEHEHEHVGGEI